jgi:hypothetical protein
MIYVRKAALTLVDETVAGPDYKSLVMSTLLILVPSGKLFFFFLLPAPQGGGVD